MWNDAGLKHDIEKELEWEPSVHGGQIGVTVKEGAVELAGHVDSFPEKCAAERAAWRVSHVKSVTSTIRVDLHFEAIRADDDIALAAMANLEWNCLVPETVDVHVADGWVTLEGHAEWHYQKQEADRALRPLRGIKGIRNHIVIQPSFPMGDVRSHIDEALRRNALVDVSHIKAHVSLGVVSLRGTARSRAEHDEALHAAWAAPGIAELEDHVTIGSIRGD